MDNGCADHWGGEHQRETGTARLRVPEKGRGNSQGSESPRGGNGKRSPIPRYNPPKQLVINQPKGENG